MENNEIMKNIPEVVNTTATATFKNERLAALTSELSNVLIVAGKTANAAHLKTAEVFSEIRREKLYEDDGFKNVEEFAAQVYGIQRATALKYCRVGDLLKSGVLPATGYNYTQLCEMCPAEPKALAEALESGEINADMSKTEIGEAVKAMKKAGVKRPEALYNWEIVGEEATETMTKTELIAHIGNNGGDFIGEVSNDGDHYIVAINSMGCPLMYRRLEKTKSKPIDTEAEAEAK